MATEMNHRDYVGGKFVEIGDLQFEFLKSRGLKEDDTLLDVACGSLRLGRPAIEYLYRGHYIGFDHHSWLIEDGITEEVGIPMLVEKYPRFIVNNEFDFSEVHGSPAMIMIHSLFTHLTKKDILHCLRHLIRFRYSTIYATFNNTLLDNPLKSDDHETFYYIAAEMEAIVNAAGWYFQLIGEWGHPRGQQMMRLTQNK